MMAPVYKTIHDGAEVTGYFIVDSYTDAATGIHVEKRSDGSLTMHGKKVYATALNLETIGIVNTRGTTGSFDLPETVFDWNTTAVITCQIHISIASNYVGDCGMSFVDSNTVNYRECWNYDYSGAGRTLEFHIDGRWRA
jgi:hypothetical protein